MKGSLLKAVGRIMLLSLTVFFTRAIASPIPTILSQDTVPKGSASLDVDAFVFGVPSTSPIVIAGGPSTNTTISTSSTSTGTIVTQEDPYVLRIVRYTTLRKMKNNQLDFSGTKIVPLNNPKFFDFGTVVGSDKKLYHALQLIPYKTDPPTSKTLDLTKDDNNQLFFLPEEDFQAGIKSEGIQKYYLTKKIFFTGGANLSSPFKDRLGHHNVTGRIENSFDLGGYFGLATRTDHFKSRYLSWIVTGGLSTVNLNASTTSSSAGMNTDTKDGLDLGLTIATGFIYSFDDLQLGIIAGMDFLGGTAGKSWDYNSRPWISFSIGYKFLGGSGEKASVLKNASN